MDSALAKLIFDYLASVSNAVEALKDSGIPMDWATNGIPGTGTLSNGATYRKHGYGCEVSLPSGLVDFDFGPDGETSGFDGWHLYLYADERRTLCGKLAQEDLDKALNSALSQGLLVRPNGRGLYYVANSA